MALAKAFQGESEEIKNVDTSKEMIIRQLTKKERDEAKRAFSKYDDNGDNRISIREAKNVLKDMGHKNPTAEDVKNWMKMAGDKDSDGYLSFKEFEMLIRQIISTVEYEEAQIRAQFKNFDLDGNGMISKEELKKILEASGNERAEQMANELIEEADEDGNGEIDYKEFRNVFFGKDEHYEQQSC